MKKTIYLLFLTIILCYGCKKDAPANSPQTRYSLLVNKKWKMSAASYHDNSGTFYPDAYSSLQAYDKDNYYYFYENGTFEENAGNLLAPGESERIMETGTWNLTSSDQLITLNPGATGSSVYGAFKILLLTNTNLSVEVNQLTTGYLITYSFIAIP